MIHQILSRPEPVAMPRLFSINQISVLSFFTGFPVGFALAYVNLKRMGNAQGARQLIWALAAGTLALLLLITFLPVSSTVYSLPFNVLCIGYLNVVMTRELQAYRFRGGLFAVEKFWNGFGLGLLGLLSWILLAGVLLLLFYVTVMVLNIHLPGLGI